MRGREQATWEDFGENKIPRKHENLKIPISARNFPISEKWGIIVRFYPFRIAKDFKKQPNPAVSGILQHGSRNVGRGMRRIPLYRYVYGAGFVRKSQILTLSAQTIAHCCRESGKMAQDGPYCQSWEGVGYPLCDDTGCKVGVA